MRGSVGRLVLPVLGVLALLGLVVVAATGSTPVGSGATRRPSDTFLDTILSLWLLALVPAAALLVYGLMQRKEIAREIASGRYRRRSVVFYLVFFALITLAGYEGILHRRWHPLENQSPEAPQIGRGVPPNGMQT